MRIRILFALALGVLLAIAPRLVAGQSQAIVGGFDAATLARNDDGSVGPVPLGFAVNLFGTQFDRVFVNNNGNVTFDSALSSFTPFPLLGTDRLIIAPFFADVDTRLAGDAVTYGSGSFGGRRAFGANWINVDYFASSTSHTRRNSFQLILVDRGDRATGDFDIVFNYGSIQWETGQASGGSADGLGGASARAGYAIGRGAPGSAFELAGSAVNGAFLDGGPQALRSGSRNSGVPGRYVFEIRGGDVSTRVGALTPFADAPSQAAVTSGSGRFVVLQTRATNLLGGSPQGASQILRIDTETGQVARASVDTTGATIGADAIEPSISHDGSLIVFVAPDAAVGALKGESAAQAEQRRKNTGGGVFLRNFLTGTTQRVGSAAPGASGTLPQIAPGASAVVYTRASANAAEGQVGQTNVFLVPLQRSGNTVTPGVERCVSCKVVGADGSDTAVAANGASGRPSVSADGVWVAFETAAKNTLATSPAPCPNAGSDVMLRNMLTGQMTRVSAPAPGSPCAPAGAVSGAPTVDHAGLRVVFESDQRLAPGDANDRRDVFLFDIAQAATALLSQPFGGGQSNGDSGQPTLSGDGRYAAFVSSATNLDTRTSDTNGAADVHVVEIGGPEATRLDTNDAGAVIAGDSARPDLSFDGSKLSFLSAAGNVAPGAVPGQTGAFQRANPLVFQVVLVEARSATWWVPQESGWGLFTVDQGSLVAPGWFTYDVDGEPTWFLVPGAAPQADGSYAGPVRRFTGVPFDRTGGNAAESSSIIGSAVLRFSGRDSLSFSYTIGATTQVKAMTRFTFAGSDLVCTPGGASRAAETNFSDLWWGGAAGGDGWGLHISHVGERLFATWYTYDADREAVFLIASTQRQADGRFVGALLRQPNGTPFAQIDGAPASAAPVQVGTAVLRFSDGQTGTFETNVNGQPTQTKPITRLVFGTAPTFCFDQPAGAMR